MRLDAARAVRRLGFVPVPHFSARRLGSRADFEQFLTGPHTDGACDNVFAVGGDPARPKGPYANSAAVAAASSRDRREANDGSVSAHPHMSATPSHPVRGMPPAAGPGRGAHGAQPEPA
jgi:methylenetetrahydrofolate reductase (NADPH)